MKKITYLNETGTIFLTTMVSMMIMILIAGYIFKVSAQDTTLVAEMKDSTQAQQVAEGGLARALSHLYSSWSSSYSISSTTLGPGTYSTSMSSSSGRYLVSSVGAVSGVNRTVTAEVAPPTVSALQYALASGSPTTALVWNSTGGGASGALTGDIYSAFNATVGGAITGSVYSGGTVTNSGTISGSTNNNWGTVVSFPTVNMSYYKNIATANGLYYSGDKTYNDSTLPAAPAGGVIYVHGNLVINGHQSATTACFVADGNITLQASASNKLQVTINQYSNYPALMTGSGGSITVSSTGNAGGGAYVTITGLIYSGNNVSMSGNHYDNPRLSLTGSVLARGALSIAPNSQSNIKMTYSAQNPPGFTNGASSMSIRSYNS